jgi:membrane protein implicated in regulation of membrane protease activity
VLWFALLIFLVFAFLCVVVRVAHLFFQFLFSFVLWFALLIFSTQRKTKTKKKDEQREPQHKGKQKLKR